MTDAQAGSVTARLSISRSSVLLLLGVLLTAALAGMRLYIPDLYESIFLIRLYWLGGFALIGLGLSALDRRIRLSIDHRGIYCRDWGPEVVPWGAFQRFEIIYQETDRFILPELKQGNFPNRPGHRATAEKLAVRLVGARHVVLPPGGLDLRPLDVREHVVIQALESHGAQIVYAPRVS